jgi:carbamate kinase
MKRPESNPFQRVDEFGSGRKRVSGSMETFWTSLESSAADLCSGTATGMIGGLERQQAAQQNWRRVGCVKQWAENFYRRVVACPHSNRADLGGFGQRGGRSIDLG